MRLEKPRYVVAARVLTRFAGDYEVVLAKIKTTLYLRICLVLKNSPKILLSSDRRVIHIDF